MAQETKTNTEKLKELQQIADDYNKIKSEVETLLNILDDLEIKYNKLTKEIQNNGR